MHTAVSLSRPVPPPLPVLARHPLDLDPLDFRRPARPSERVVSAVGDPPRHLAKYHRPAVVNAVLEVARARLREPVRTLDGTALSTRELCGLFTFHCHDSGEMTVLRHERRTGRAMKRTEVDATTFDIERFLPMDAWSASIRSELFDAVFRADFAHPAPIRDYVDWAHAAVCDKLVRDGEWRDIGDDLYEALGFEPMYVSIARGIPPERGKPAASLAAYNHVVRHAEEYEQLLIDNDDLIPLYGICRDAVDFPGSGEPVARLRRFFLSRKLSAALWRRVTGKREADRYRACVREYPALGIGAAHFAVYAMVDKLGPENDPPEWLIATLIAENIRPALCHVDAGCAAQFAAARRIAMLHRHADPERRQAMREMIGLVLQWAEACPDFVDASIARLSWTGLARRARAHREREVMANVSFQVPFERLEIDGYVVSALSTTLALADEGREMHHCVATYAQRCIHGALFVCSIRRPGDRTARWTAAYRSRLRDWELESVAGFANAEASLGAKLIASLVLERLNRDAQ